MAMLFSFLILLLSIATTHGMPELEYCQPSNKTCWPTESEINTFSTELDGQLLLKNLSNPQYTLLINQVTNSFRVSYPSFIVMTKSHQDVQNCVRFASSHNIQLRIQSTGHSYSGRNNANNSLQINLSNMQKYSVNKDVTPPTLTVETGLRYGPIFNIVNTTMPNYVLVGAGDNSVGPFGHSSLGGHSGITARHGLASDHIKEYYLVDPNANIIHVYNTSSKNKTIDDLYWALRGGGASTFGVVLNMTFELIQVRTDQNPNDVYTLLSCVYPGAIADIVLSGYFNYIQNGLDPLVSGYLLIDLIDNIYAIILYLNYFGDSGYANKNFEPLTKLNTNNPNGNYCSMATYKHFWDWWSTSVPDTNDGDLYIFNNYIPAKNLTNEFANTISAFINSSHVIRDKFGFGAIGTIIGGNNNLNNYPYGSTAVGAGFRTSYFSYSTGVGWAPNATQQVQNNAITYSQKWEETFRAFGNGIYSNEENKECDGCDWKQAFWQQSNYQRLLSLKQKIDPNQVFWCNHCVGSDVE